MNAENLRYKLYTTDAYVINDDVGQFIYEFIREKQPQTIVELGSGQGFGTYWIASAISNKATFYSIDQDISFSKIAEQKCAKFDNKIIFIVCPIDIDGWYLLPNYLPRKIDLLIVDGPSGLCRGKAFDYFDFKYCIADDGYRHGSDFPHDFVILDIDGGIGFYTKALSK